MGLRPAQDHEKSSQLGIATLPFVISTEAERRDLRVDVPSWKCFARSELNGAVRRRVSPCGTYFFNTGHYK
jgi:hypothetical protein